MAPDDLMALGIPKFERRKYSNFIARLKDSYSNAPVGYKGLKTGILLLLIIRSI